MSAGLGALWCGDVASALTELVKPLGVLARNDVPLRVKRRPFDGCRAPGRGRPARIQVAEHGARYFSLLLGRKFAHFWTSARAASPPADARGRALDCFKTRRPVCHSTPRSPAPRRSASRRVERDHAVRRAPRDGGRTTVVAEAVERSPRARRRCDTFSRWSRKAPVFWPSHGAAR